MLAGLFSTDLIANFSTLAPSFTKTNSVLSNDFFWFPPITLLIFSLFEPICVCAGTPPKSHCLFFLTLTYFLPDTFLVDLNCDCAIFYYLNFLPFALIEGLAFSEPIPLDLKPLDFLPAPVKPLITLLVCLGETIHETCLSDIICGW